MKNLIHLLLSAVAVVVSSYLIPSVSVDSFGVALIVALVLGLLNAFLRPILIILTLPITVLSLGLFALVINTFMIMLAASLVPGFHVATFTGAFIFSIVLFFVNMGVQSIAN